MWVRFRHILFFITVSLNTSLSYARVDCGNIHRLIGKYESALNILLHRVNLHMKAYNQYREKTLALRARYQRQPTAQNAYAVNKWNQKTVLIQQSLNREKLKIAKVQSRLITYRQIMQTRCPKTQRYIEQHGVQIKKKQNKN